MLTDSTGGLAKGGGTPAPPFVSLEDQVFGLREAGDPAVVRCTNKPAVVRHPATDVVTSYLLPV